MNPVWPALRRVMDDLRGDGVRFAVVGGLATSARTEPRFTRDVDLAVAVTDDTEAEGVVRRLVHAGYSLVQLVEQEHADRLATARLMPPGEGGRVAIVDLLFASSGIEVEIVEAAEVLELGGGLRAPVATIGHLAATKLLSTTSARPQDEIDLAGLRAEATSEDVAAARAAVELIESRGFARRRDLRSALETWAASES